MRFRARLMYDGLAYAGLQFQENAPSIANELQVALAKRTQQDVRVIAAGRTDTGVHARGQAIHFDVDGDRFSDDPEAFQTAVNCMLPQDVRLVQLERAQERDAEGRRWHSMYWATGKLYSYRFHSGHPIGCMDPTQRLYRHQERRGPLCLDRMQAAADYFVGEHDFASFANKGATGVRQSPAGARLPSLSTVRRVRSITIHDEGDGYARADVHLKGALYKQVRNMVGLLFEVGDGRREATDVPELMALRSRTGLPKPAPALGLTLESVYYNVGWDGAFRHPLHTDTVGLGGDAGSLLRAKPEPKG